jgi:hypothetical protein
MTHQIVFLMALQSLIVVPLAAQTLRAFDFHSEKLDTASDNHIRVVKAEYEVYADGNIKDVVGEDAEGTTASGSLGVGYSTGRFIINALVNAVGTATPLTENFGTALLAPAAGNSLSAGVLDTRFSFFKRPRDGGVCSSFGMRAYGSVSSARWEVDTAGTTFGVVTPGFGLGLFCQMLNVREPATGTDAGRSLAVVIDFGGAVRGIAGDVAQSSNDEVRRTIIGERNKRTWVGVEAGIAIQLNGLKAGLTLYAFPGEIPGLSDGQVTAGFSVQSSLLSGRVRRPANAKDIARLTPSLIF